MNHLVQLASFRRYEKRYYKGTGYCGWDVKKAFESIGWTVSIVDNVKFEISEIEALNPDLIFYTDGIKDPMVSKLKKIAPTWFGNSEISEYRKKEKSKRNLLEATRVASIASCYDRVEAEYLTKETSREVLHLVCPVDTDVFKPENRCDKHDVSFIGTGRRYRQNVMNKLARDFNVITYGMKFKKLCDYREFCGCLAKINLDMPEKEEQRARLGERLLRILACGGFALVRDNSDYGLPPFEDGIHYVAFSGGEDVKDLREKIAYYLKHADKREAIAAAGCRFVRENFNLKHSAQWMVGILEDYLRGRDGHTRTQA